MKKIPLTQCKFALVDDADFDWLNQWKWHTLKGGKNFYAQRNVQSGDKRRKVLMHREILPGPARVDHRDRDGLNNQRGNLRAASHRQNIHNQRKREGRTTPFKGVYPRTNGAKEPRWESQIRINGCLRYLGLFSDEKDAARAYNNAAVEAYGKFARLNPI